MGGDLSLLATIHGIDYFVSTYNVSDVSFSIFGDAVEIEKRLSEFTAIKRSAIEIHDTGTNVISGSEKPATAMKHGSGTSMFEAIDSVAKGQADAVVSSGNTGAYMALSKILIGTIENIDRPALVGVIPNTLGKTVMLDLGANTDCSSIKLTQFAMMGNAVATTLLGIKFPKVGLLNIGTEASKGTKILAETYDALSGCKSINFIGFVEGTDVTNGVVDVIVTDGFSGNISLKTMEGTIRYINSFLKSGFSSGFVTRIGYMLCRKVFKDLKDTIDPSSHNGVPLVGLKKIAVKSHGSSDFVGFANAISVAVNLARSSFVKSVEDSLCELSYAA
jgi:glycerol-3-phosphate acyltransferase PlsX